MFTVFALGELYSPAAAKGGGTPGVSFFDQAMNQHVDLYEDPTISYIESLLLIVRFPLNKQAKIVLLFTCAQPEEFCVYVRRSGSALFTLPWVTSKNRRYGDVCR